MRRQLFTLWLSLLLVNAVKAEAPVCFEDQELKALVEETLWISDPTPTDMLALTGLECPKGGIRSLTGLEYATNLRRLSIIGNLIADLSPLSGLTDLQTLILEYNLVSDISPLSGLTNLEELSLRENLISDISALSGLTQLKTVNLHKDKVSDISPLTSLTCLQWLDLRVNPLNDRAYSTDIAQIKANNPGMSLFCDPMSDRKFASHLLISSTAGGAVVSPGEGAFVCECNETVVLEAKPDPGFLFVNWTGTFATPQNPLDLCVRQDYQFRANFLSTRDVLYVDRRASGGLTASGTPESPFVSIQEAIDVAPEGATILVAGGVYRENIDLQGKSVCVRNLDSESPDEDDWPVIDGGGQGAVVCFTHGEDSNCVFSGFVLTGGQGASAAAIWCSASSPTIANCLIVGNRVTNWTGGVIHCTDSNATFINCTVADNYAGAYGAGLYLTASPVVVVNSIFWGNAPTEIITDGIKAPSVRYSTIAGGWPDTGNLKADPLFAGRGRWVDRNHPDLVVRADNPNAVWVMGDYHLQSQAGRWDPEAHKWMQDGATSPCIDAGDPAAPVGCEPAPNGGIVGQGAYGGTTQASKSALSQ
jgi:hypothetical protein